MSDLDDILEPLQAIPLNKFHVIYKSEDMRNKIKYHTTVYKYIRKMPIYPAAIDRRWRKDKKDEIIEEEENEVNDEIGEAEEENNF